MIDARTVARTIRLFPENELIHASKLYTEQLSNAVGEDAYYQLLGRMCKAGTLCRIAKGIYYRPQMCKYGIVPLSQKEIVAAFTEPDKGTVVGYSLYNSLKLTTQVAKTIEVLSSEVEQQTKTIGGVLLKSCDLHYTPEVKNMIHMLDVLQNFEDIQDLNYRQFISFCKDSANGYNEKAFGYVLTKQRYQKKTISFLRNILDYYGVENSLNKHLSVLSEYRHPTMEEIYEAAYFLKDTEI